MIIDWSNFTPWSALDGGGLIGLVAALLFLGLGRIAGISGMLGSVLQGETAEAGWRLVFLGGLLIAPAVWSVVIPGAPSLSAPAVDAPGG